MEERAQSRGNSVAVGALEISEEVKVGELRLVEFDSARERLRKSLVWEVGLRKVVEDSIEGELVFLSNNSRAVATPESREYRASLCKAPSIEAEALPGNSTALTTTKSSEVLRRRGREGALASTEGCFPFPLGSIAEEEDSDVPKIDLNKDRLRPAESGNEGDREVATERGCAD